MRPTLEQIAFFFYVGCVATYFLVNIYRNSIELNQIRREMRITIQNIEANMDIEDGLYDEVRPLKLTN